MVAAEAQAIRPSATALLALTWLRRRLDGSAALAGELAGGVLMNDLGASLARRHVVELAKLDAVRLLLLQLLLLLLFVARQLLLTCCCSAAALCSASRLLRCNRIDWWTPFLVIGTAFELLNLEREETRDEMRLVGQIGCLWSCLPGARLTLACRCCCCCGSK